MRNEALVILVLFLFAFSCNKNVKKMETSASSKVNFPSLDGLMITADIYQVSDSAPVILLCHQARSGRGEYIATARRLNEMGFNCIAIDQRSGDESNGVKNETAALAVEKNLPTDYIHAEQDIVAGVNYAFNKYHRKIILFGSSYSGSLALIIAKNNDKVGAVVAFSPGEYFDESDYLVKSIKGFDKPVFLTSARTEVDDVKVIFNALGSRDKTQYIPQSAGMHASRVLWADNPSNQEYWKALTAFLNRFKSLK